MDPNALLRLLNLDAQPAEAGSHLTEMDPVGVVPADEVGPPTVLKLDEWGLRRGRDLVTESERLQKLAIDEYAAADFHAAAFEPEPELLPACCDARRREFLAQMLGTPDYHALHADTRLDDTASSIAAVAFAVEFAKLNQDGGAGAAEPGSLDAEMAALRAAGRAVLEASKEVETMREAAAAMGLGPGAPGSNDPAAIAALYRRVRNDPQLRRICELAGRYRRVAQSKQRRKTVHGLDDVVGVEPGGDVGRLLPVELAKLALPELELDTLRRLTERQALCREYHATEPVAKGPIIVCADESGSMEGDRATTAKALALALAWVARSQRRWAALVAFSGDTGERLLALPPSQWDEAALVEWLSAFIGGGSTLDVPVVEMPRIYSELKAPVGDTDVLFLTDAKCTIPSEVAATFNAWKASVKARLITLVIASPPGDLTLVSDEVHVVPSLAADESAVERVLSL